jgi:hypothetical protein
VRELFDLRIFLACATQLRLERRLARDVAERGRSLEAVREQFWKTVAPMHDRFVAPQARWADIILTEPPSEAEVQGLVDLVGRLEPGSDPTSKLEPPMLGSFSWPREGGRQSIGAPQPMCVFHESSGELAPRKDLIGS